MTFDIIQRNFERGLWNAQMVAVAVQKGVITTEQYQQITGEVYVAPVG